MTAPIPATTDELRAAFSRVPLLHLLGWTLDRAMAAPLVAWSLEKSALSYRKTHHLPAQPRLI